MCSTCKNVNNNRQVIALIHCFFNQKCNTTKRKKKKKVKVKEEALPVNGSHTAAGCPKSHFYRNDRKTNCKTHLWYNFKIVKHSEGMPFDCIEMILTIFMKFLPHHTGLFLSSTLCIAPLAPREHFQNHRIFFHRQE